MPAGSYWQFRRPWIFDNSRQCHNGQRVSDTPATVRRYRRTPTGRITLHPQSVIVSVIRGLLEETNKAASINNSDPFLYPTYPQLSSSSQRLIAPLRKYRSTSSQRKGEKGGLLSLGELPGQAFKASGVEAGRRGREHHLNGNHEAKRTSPASHPSQISLSELFSESQCRRCSSLVFQGATVIHIGWSDRSAAS